MVKTFSLTPIDYEVYYTKRFKREFDDAHKLHPDITDGLDSYIKRLSIKKTITQIKSSKECKNYILYEDQDFNFKNFGGCKNGYRLVHSVYGNDLILLSCYAKAQKEKASEDDRKQLCKTVSTFEDKDNNNNFRHLRCKSRQIVQQPWND